MQLLRDPALSREVGSHDRQRSSRPTDPRVVPHHALENRAAREIDDPVASVLDVARDIGDVATFMRSPGSVAAAEVFGR